MADKKSQAEKFKEAARKIGADESDDALDRLFKKIDPKKKPEPKKPSKSKK